MTRSILATPKKSNTAAGVALAHMLSPHRIPAWTYPDVQNMQADYSSVQHLVEVSPDCMTMVYESVQSIDPKYVKATAERWKEQFNGTSVGHGDCTVNGTKVNFDLLEKSHGNVKASGQIVNAERIGVSSDNEPTNTLTGDAALLQLPPLEVPEGNLPMDGSFVAI